VAKATKALEAELLARLQAAPVRRRRSDASSWDGRTYGYGAGRPHPCVEFVGCSYCRARVGELCRGPHGAKFSTHYPRREDFQAMKRRLLEKSD
jgi:hypothetical protein